MGLKKGVSTSRMWSRLWCWFFVFLTLASASSARNIIPLQGKFSEVVIPRRSLMVSLNDYGDPSANPGHDPPPTGRRRA